MKVISLLVVVFTAVAGISTAQTIHRVNNNPGMPGAGIYATLQEAHDAASNGDIIYVEGSNLTYGNLDCTKQLTIIGPGYFLNENFSGYPEVRTAKLDYITFADGSAGSSIQGFDDNAVNNEYFTMSVKVSNITISKNRNLFVRVDPAVSTVISGIQLSKNYDIWIQSYDLTANGGTINISNNLLTGFRLSSNFTGTIANNTIDDDMGGMQAYNMTFTNNVVNSMTSSSLSATNCTFYNNIDARSTTGSALFGTSNGNQANVDKLLVFEGATGNSTDGKWRLKAGSPAIGAGYQGVDCGMFGGIDPYKLSGIPAYPTIKSLMTSGSGSNTTPLNVTISTQSNN